MHWPHVILDYLHVWKPGDSPPDEDGRRKINYIAVMAEIEDILIRFPSTTKISFDQYDSALGMAQLRQKFSPHISVAEVIFTEKENQRRAERFKNALNLGWVSAYRDHLYEDGGSLLEMECKFLSERNMKVVKQDFGPVQTKDLFDAVSVVVTDLLHEALDRYRGQSLVHPLFGSSETAGLRSGREFLRQGGSSAHKRLSQMEPLMPDNPARDMLAGMRTERNRRGAYVPNRASQIRERASNTRAGRGRRL
jgi:hypothetical protein